jgi:hypothetical protein
VLLLARPGTSPPLSAGKAPSAPLASAALQGGKVDERAVRSAWSGGPFVVLSIETPQRRPKRRHEPLNDTACLGELGRRQLRNHFVYPVPGNVNVDLP